jgi:hypothetical protein
MVADGEETGELVPGLGRPALGIADAQGRFGAALELYAACAQRLPHPLRPGDLERANVTRTAGRSRAIRDAW